MENMQRLTHKISIEKGWWKKDRNNGELIALMHSELSEALEWLRNKDGLTDKEVWENVGEEMADTVLRIMDFCEARNINLNQEIWKKMDKNKKRQKKHGKQF